MSGTSATGGRRIVGARSMDDSWFLPHAAQIILALAVFGLMAWIAEAVLGPRLKGSGGWKRLAAAFPAGSRIPTAINSRQTLKVGKVIWRNCVRVGLGEEGLYLAITGPLLFLRWPDLLIPWPEIRSAVPTSLFWRQHVMLSVARPEISTITVPDELYRRMLPHLPVAARLPVHEGAPWFAPGNRRS